MRWSGDAVAADEPVVLDITENAYECGTLDTAVGAGALGARMTGGGFGGSAVVLVEAADAETVTKAVEEAFATAPRVFPAVPSAGARRVE